MKIYDKGPKVRLKISQSILQSVPYCSYKLLYLYKCTVLPRSQYAIVGHAMFCLITVMQHSVSDGGEFLFNLFNIKFTDYMETDYLKLTPAHI